VAFEQTDRISPAEPSVVKRRDELGSSLTNRLGFQFGKLH